MRPIKTFNNEPAPHQSPARSLSRRGLLKSLAGGAAALAFTPALQAAVTRPKLTVVLIAEQFRSDYLYRNINAFGATGFRRLLDESSFFPDCRLLSASYTMSGLATIATGCYASMHGIVANRWFEAGRGRLHVAGPSDLMVTTLFQQPAGTNRFIAIAGTESKARLFQPEANRGLYFRTPNNTFTTIASPGSEPVWLGAFNESSAEAKFQNRAWSAHGSPAGAVPLRTLTYDPAKPENYRALLASSPFAQSPEINLVREVIHGENLGTTGSDTVVAVLDSLGKLGSETGAVSPLIDDEVISLDSDLSELLEWLDSRGQSYQFVFTGAHGAPVEPSTTSRVSPDDIVLSVERALSSAFGNGNANLHFVEAFVYPFLYLRMDHLKRDELPLARKLAGAAAVGTGHVATYMTADGYSPASGDWAARTRNSFFPGRSGDVFVAYRPGFVEYIGVDRGISYGSVWNYDTQVPLLLKGPSFVAERFDHRVELTDIAPTLAAVAGIPPPAAASGRVLTEAFGEGLS